MIRRSSIARLTSVTVLLAYVALAVVSVAFHSHSEGSCDTHVHHGVQSCGADALENSPASSAQLPGDAALQTVSDSELGQECPICQFHGKQIFSDGPVYQLAGHIISRSETLNDSYTGGTASTNSARGPPASSYMVSLSS